VLHRVPLIDILRRTPVVLPALLAIALFVIWSSSEGGYPVTHWAPGGLVLLALLAIALWSAPVHVRELPRALRVALACLAAYAALSYLSILWAQVPADAWEGANRTLLYLLVLALFSLWPLGGRAASLLLCVWIVAMIGLAAYVLLHVSGSAAPAGFFGEDRLKYPAGYENAAAACWCMAMWPAVLLARSPQLVAPLRGLLAGGAVLMGDVALLSQSRGALYATALMLILVFALLPGRVRTFLVLIPVAGGIGLTAPAILHVGDRLLDGGDVKSALHTAALASLLATVAVGAIVTACAALERRAPLSASASVRFHRVVAAVALVILVGVILGGLVAAGDPVARVENAWHTFKGGYSANNSHVNRLVGGFGSGRYDFYRVGLDEFAAHPLLGIGADNFQQQYLAHARTGESPHYPHSVELRALVQGGVIGALIALVGLVAALLCGGRAALAVRVRRDDPLAAAVAAAALGGFAYWLVHGSFDWFWEFAGLGAPAFALLGLACSLTPRAVRLAPVPGIAGSAPPRAADASASRAPDAAQAEESGSTTLASGSPRRHEAQRRGPLTPARAGLVSGIALALVAAVSFVLPWFSQLQVERAAQIWPTAPRQAYSALDRAANLNPLSDEPYVLAGSIALRFGDLSRADREFALALERNSNDTYATLERGAIASARGERREALLLIERAHRLSRRNELISEVLAIVREGRRIDVEVLNRSILGKSHQFA